MNSRERRTYWRAWHRFIAAQQKRWYPRLLAALRKQVAQFTDYARQHSLAAAQMQMASVVTIQPLMEALPQLYRQIGLDRARFIAQQERRYREKKKTMGNNERLIELILQHFQQTVLNKSVYPITEYTRKQILKVVSQGFQQGLGEDEILAMVTTSEYTESHARLVVRTEAVRSANAGAELYAQESPLLYDKQWISAKDSRVRRPPKSKYDHWDLDGQVVPGDRPFFSGGEELKYPGDPNGSAGNVCNCRCTTAYVPRRDANGRLMRKPVRTVISATLPNSTIPELQIMPDSSATQRNGIIRNIGSALMGEAFGELISELF